MKKQEILSILKENKITSSNLKTFLGKNKKNKALGRYDRIREWMQKEADSELLKEQKIIDIKHAKSFGLSLKKYIELKKTAESCLADFHTWHSMGCFRQLWVNNIPFAINDTLGTYSKSCKFKPTYGDLVIFLDSIAELKTLTCKNGYWETKKHKITSSGTKASHEIVLTKIK